MIFTETDDSKIEFYAVNNLSVQHEVTLKLYPVNLDGYTVPITKLIPARDTLYMTKLGIKPGERWSFKYQSSYRAMPTEEEIQRQDEALKQMTLDKLEELDEGIVLFYRDGCPRCAFATNYMLDRDMKFTVFDVTDDQENSRLMWDLIRLEKPELNNVLMPVMLVDGEIAYDIENLEGFVRKLRKQFKD